MAAGHGIIVLVTLLGLAVSWPVCAQVVINEIHYHPFDAQADAEFIEIHNPGAEPVSLGGFILAGFAGTPFTFPAGVTVPAAGYVVVAKEPALLQSLVDVPAPLFAWPSGSLSNAGESAVLVTPMGALVDQVTFVDTPPWPTSPDGLGPSLELVHPDLDNALPRSWRASVPSFGTPGAANSVLDEAPFVIAEAPERGSVIGELDHIEVWFHKPVTGVTAADLTVGGVQATNVIGDGAGPYRFGILAADGDTVDVALAPGVIEDLDGNPFGGDSWQYAFSLPRIRINEIHYHPSINSVHPGEDPEQLQFLELINADDESFDLSELVVTEGISHRFPSGTELAPGELLVLAKNATFLMSRAPNLPQDVPVLTWDRGNLNNGGELLRITDLFGNVIDELTYDDEGSWPPTADGDGPSLELINPGLPNRFAVAWEASVTVGGTPGLVNESFLADPPPLLLEPLHQPPIPAALEPVSVTIRAIDDGDTPPVVTLFHRLDRASALPYQSVPMLDDGLSGDGRAGDGIYGATVAGLLDEQVMDFYIEATDGTHLSTLPKGHAVLDDRNNPSQTFLCRFSDEVLPTDLPVYHMNITADDVIRQSGLTGSQRKMLFDATFIDDAGNIYYNVTERWRGGTSMLLEPRSYHVNFSADKPLVGPLGFPIKKLVLNANNPARQELGYDAFRKAGLVASRTAFVRLRHAGINYDDYNHGVDGNGYHGAFIVVEHVDSEYLNSQHGLVPDRGLTSDGNLYWCHNTGDLSWQGTDPAIYDANLHNGNGYEKINNETEYQWDDLIGLLDALNNTPDETFVQVVEAAIDVDQWMRWFAVHNAIVNREGGIWRDFGDDYYIFFNPLIAPGGPVARLLPWDMDSVWKLDPTQTIWRTEVPAVARLLRHNAFAPIFVKAIRDLIDGPYSLEAMEAKIDSMPDAAWASSGPDSRQAFKTFVSRRVDSVNTQIIAQLSLGGVPPSPHSATDPIVPLGGSLNQAGTHAVRVNGQLAAMDVFDGKWAHDLTLTPGRNDILVEALDRQGAVTESQSAVVEYSPPGAPDCASDVNCNDHDPCTRDTCDTAGNCSNVALADGETCEDGLACTVGDVCLSGRCVGDSVCLADQGCGPDGLCGVPREIKIFRDGFGYAGTHDTYLTEPAPTSVRGSRDSWEWDTTATAEGGLNIGLLRFDDIVGDGPGQIPQGVHVTSARVTLSLFDPSGAPLGSVHEVNVDWSEDSTHFNNFGSDSGVSPDEVGAYVTSAPIGPGLVSIDVTRAVQRWVDDPTTNRGLIFLPSSPSDAEVRSSEYAVASERPMLSVEHYAGCGANADCDDGLGCNGSESCGRGQCLPGIPIFCDDGLSCTVDGCDEDIDACTHLPVNGLCDDGMFCNGAESCDAAVGCRAGTLPAVDDGEVCTLDVCDEPSDTIRHEVDEAFCGVGIELYFDAPSTLEWTDATGFDAWNLYAGDLALLASTGSYTQPETSGPLARQICGLLEPLWSLALEPASGEVAFLLISGVLDGSEGGLGLDGNGAFRPGSGSCP